MDGSQLFSGGHHVDKKAAAHPIFTTRKMQFYEKVNVGFFRVHVYSKHVCNNSLIWMLEAMKVVKLKQHWLGFLRAALAFSYIKV